MPTMVSMISNQCIGNILCSLVLYYLLFVSVVAYFIGLLIAWQRTPKKQQMQCGAVITRLIFSKIITKDTP